MGPKPPSWEGEGATYCALTIDVPLNMADAMYSKLDTSFSVYAIAHHQPLSISTLRRLIHVRLPMIGRDAKSSDTTLPDLGLACTPLLQERRAHGYREGDQYGRIFVRRTLGNARSVGGSSPTIRQTPLPTQVSNMGLARMAPSKTRVSASTREDPGCRLCSH